MRIVTWNCCRGDMAAKIAEMMKLRPDVLLLQEAVGSCLPESTSFAPIVRDLGIATLAFDGFAIDEEDAIGSALRTRIVAPDGFAFEVVNVWTQKAPTYIADAISVLRAFEQVVASGDAVVAGDFNACGPAGRA